jgi:uncharacterized protein involved in exopolysaccharide biosynthesis
VTKPVLLRVGEYKKKFTAQPIKKESNIIRISTVTDMPTRGRDFIRLEIDYYNQDAVEDKNMMAENTASFLQGRLELLKKDLVTAEAAITKFQEEHNVIDFGKEAELSLLEGTEYRKRLAEIETELHLVHFLDDFLTDTTNKNSAIPANLGFSDEALVSAIGRYNGLILKKARLERTATNENPLLQQIDMELALVRKNINACINNVRSTLSIQKEDLQARYKLTEQGIGAMPAVRLEYAEMVREKKIKEQLYLFLSRQREENALTLASTVMPAKVIAVPQVNPIPVSPRLKYYALIFFILGMGIPIGVMFMYDLMNDCISHDQKELENKLKIPLAGMLVKNHR